MKKIIAVLIMVFMIITPVVIVGNTVDEPVKKEYFLPPPIKPTVTKIKSTPTPEVIITPEITPTPESPKYTEDELHILSHVITGEANGCSWDMMIGVGSVVLNRVNSNRFPNTIEGVVFQKGQYACTWDGNYDRTPSQQAIDAAIYLLENGSQMPPEVVWQASFRQGKNVYKKIGNTYFCS